MDLMKYFDGGFPLTKERLQFINDSIRRGSELITKIAGSGNLIVEGVELLPTGFTDGTIIINGEILPFEASPFGARIAIFETEINVPYNEDADNDGNLDQKPADTFRVARAAGTGGVESFVYSTFKRVGQLSGAQLPIGSIIPFDGDVNDIPIGWELYDLSDTFLMGSGGTVSNGATGGSNSIILKKSNIPNYTITGNTGFGGFHSHTYKDSYYVEAFESPDDDIPGFGSDNTGRSLSGSGSLDGDNPHIWYREQRTDAETTHQHSINLNSGGNSEAIDNRPKFKAVRFIRRVSI